MSAIIYRRPETSDTDALCALGRTTFIETFGHLYSAADLQAFLERAFGPTGLPADFADPAYAFHVVEREGLLLGYCKVGPSQLPTPNNGRRKCELRQLYILRSWHGQGIAQVLMQWALDWARSGDFDDMYLSVWSENYRAQRFYLKYGFEKVGDYTFMVGEHADHDFLFGLRLTDRAPR